MNTHRVAILVNAQTSLFELACATELFLLPRPEFKSWYKGDVVSFGRSQVTATGNLNVGVKSVTHLDGYHTVVVPAWSVDEASTDMNLRDALLTHLDQGGRLISFCSGAFLLGRIGVLDNRDATTHWRYFDQFIEQFPNCKATNNVLYCFDGRLGTSAGSAAALDLGLEIIRQDFGGETARQVAKRLVVAPHRKGGQAQYTDTPKTRYHNEFDATLAWAQNNLAQSISVTDLANKSCMSRRTFDRRFKAQMGVSPKHWLIEQRLDLAQRTLERFNTPAESLAELAGFENAASLRHHFKLKLGVTPRQFRDNFLASHR